MAKALTVASINKMKPDPAKRIEVPDGVLAGLYLVIQPSGSRSWAVRYRAAGVSRKLTLGTYPVMDLETARDSARDAILAAKRGGDPAAQKVESKRQQKATVAVDTFDAVVRKYLIRDAKNNRSWLETARLLGLVPDGDAADPKSFRAAPGGIVEAWGSRSIADIKPSEIIDRLDAIVDRGAPIVANRTLAAVRRFFNWTVERQMLPTSPAASIKAPAPEISRDRVLSDDEIRWVWKAADGLGYPFGPIVKLLLLTGQRRE
ncbi:MAG: tyrosine-type recombinase/integrase [Cypionkella sp.]